MNQFYYAFCVCLNDLSLSCFGHCLPIRRRQVVQVRVTRAFRNRAIVDCVRSAEHPPRRSLLVYGHAKRWVRDTCAVPRGLPLLPRTGCIGKGTEAEVVCCWQRFAPLCRNITFCTRDSAELLSILLFLFSSPYPFFVAISQCNYCTFKPTLKLGRSTGLLLCPFSS